MLLCGRCSLQDVCMCCVCWIVDLILLILLYLHSVKSSKNVLCFSVSFKDSVLSMAFLRHAIILFLAMECSSQNPFTSYGKQYLKLPHNKYELKEGIWNIPFLVYKRKMIFFHAGGMLILSGTILCIFNLFIANIWIH